MSESATVDPSATYLAPKKLRLANFAIDWIFVFVFSFIVAIFLTILGFGGLFERMGIFEEYFFSIVVYVLYYVTFEGAFGWTVAKLITKTRIVDASGATPGFAKLLARSFIRVVPFEMFSFLGKGPVGWHDTWSGTRVISLGRSGRQTVAESFAAWELQHQETSK